MKYAKNALSALLVLSLLAGLFLLVGCAHEAPRTADDIVLSESSLTLVIGQTHVLSPTLASGNTDTFTYKSADPAIVTVSASGELEAVDVGRTVILIRGVTSKLAASLVVNVEDDPFEGAITTGAFTLSVPQLQYLIYSDCEALVQLYGHYGLSVPGGEGGTALDAKKPLREQNYSVTAAANGERVTVTWFDFFANRALETAKATLVLCEAAAMRDITPTDEDGNKLIEAMTALQNAANEKGLTLAAFLNDRYGEGVTEEAVGNTLYMQMLASKAYGVQSDEIENNLSWGAIYGYYEEHAKEFDIYADVVFHTFTATYDPTGGSNDYDAYLAKKEAYLSYATQLAGATSKYDFTTSLTELLMLDGADEATARAAAQKAERWGYNCTNGTALGKWLLDGADSIRSYDTNILTDYREENGSDGPCRADITVCFVINPLGRDYRATAQNVGHILFSHDTYEGLDDLSTLNDTQRELADYLLYEGKPISAKNMALALLTILLEADALRPGYNADGNAVYTLDSETFRTVASELTDDGNVFYENVTCGQMVEEFENWLFTAGRAYGEISMTPVETAYGYHIMYYVNEADDTARWETQAKQALTEEDLAAWMDGLLESTSFKIGRKNIAQIP